MPCETVTVEPGSPSGQVNLIGCETQLDEFDPQFDELSFWATVENESDIDREVGVVWRLDGTDALSSTEVISAGSEFSMYAIAEYSYLHSTFGPGEYDVTAEIVQVDTADVANPDDEVFCQRFLILEAGDDPCDVVTCPPGEECDGGDCVPVDPCDDVDCGECETCENGDCVPVSDPCCGVDCDSGEECVDGDCVPTDPCAPVSCPECQVCDGGDCVPVDNPCCGVSCPDGQVCDGGQCVPGDGGACEGVTCPDCRVCEGGQCVPVEDPCCGISCPDGKVCDGGQCVESGGRSLNNRLLGIVLLGLGVAYAASR